MIIAKPKPIEEIAEESMNYNKILIVGCNECVTVCEAGGKKEVAVLASALRMYLTNQGQENRPFSWLSDKALHFQEAEQDIFATRVG